MTLFCPFIATHKLKMSKSCGLNVEQQQQLRIHIDLFLYMNYAKRCLQHFKKILPSAHFLTGCDSISSFLGIAEKSVSKLLKTKGLERFEKPGFNGWSV